MELTDTSTPTELARALRMEGFWAPQNVTRWLKGSSKPDYDSTLALLAAAGMLNLEDPRAQLHDEPTLRDVLEEIRALDRKLDAESLPATAQRLEEVARRLEEVPR